MRNTIFISAFCLAALPALAQEGPPTGCYARTYSQAHLDAHPDQVVRSVTMLIRDETHDGMAYRFAWLVVDFADQGHVRKDGLGAQRLDQSLTCFESDGVASCAVDCDGGAFQVTKVTADSLTISTNSLMVGEVEGCGGAINMAEHVGREVKYRLMKVPMDQCLATVEN